MRGSKPTMSPFDPTAPLASRRGLDRLRALIALPPARSEEARSELRPTLVELLTTDPAPIVRRMALRVLFSWSPPGWTEALVALDDPVWRVRRELITGLLRVGGPWQGEILEAARGQARDRAAQGVVAMLEDGWGLPHAPLPDPIGTASDRLDELPLHDHDPPVLLGRLEGADLSSLAPRLVPLLALKDSRQQNDVLLAIRRLLVGALARHGTAESDAEAIGLLADPRQPFVVEAVLPLLGQLPPARQEALAARVLGEPAAPALARRWAEERALPPRLTGPSYFAPSAVSPGPDALPRAEAEEPGDLSVEVQRRRLGVGGPLVGPLCLSGRYPMPARLLDEALDHGVDLFFWEPTYEALGHHLVHLAPARRRALTVVAGSFQASGAAIRRDVERTLRTLRLDVLPVFLLFWARSAGRLSDEALLALERLREEGKLRQMGLSTHDRTLARSALGLGFEILMVRHSAAHRGAEEQVFPAARASGAGVLTFSCTCYGRLLIERPGFGRAPAPDLYRYSLASPGVSAAIMAPRTPAELRENLVVLRRPALSPEALGELQRRGASVYRESRLFFELLRSR